MRVIQSTAPGSTSPGDVEAIAKEMVNIYHGRRHYAEDGTRLETPEEGYLTWSEGDIDYECVPSRGIIWVCYDNKSPPKDEAVADFADRLRREFHRQNRWGWREEAFVSHLNGTDEYTLEVIDMDDDSNFAHMSVTTGDPYHLAKAKRSTKVDVRMAAFEWIVATSCYEYPEAAVNFANPSVPLTDCTAYHSFASIAFDPAHRLPFKGRSVALPALPNKFTALNAEHVITITAEVGFEFELWKAAGRDLKLLGDHVSGYAHYTDCIANGHLTAVDASTPVPRLVRWAEWIHNTPPVGKKTPAVRPQECASCAATLWGTYYIIQNDKATMAVNACKFCLHWFAVASEKNGSHNRYRTATAVITDPTSILSRIEDLVLRDIVSAGLASETMTETSKPFGIDLEGGKALLFGKYIGLSSTFGSWNTVMKRYPHLIPEGSVVFQYQQID